MRECNTRHFSGHDVGIIRLNEIWSKKISQVNEEKDEQNAMMRRKKST